ncbi:MAG TPA: choice-of-anchor tandem repeat GloVer-containing protein [Candidatus Sulfotelmatobacter sp.]|jgi:uncharacterized repeat protein (TIGR03803 family)
MKLKFAWNSIKRGRASLVLALALTAMLTATPAAQAQTFTVIHTFTGGNDGIDPLDALLLAPDGIYGNTYDGGGNSSIGTVFRIDKMGEYTVLYRFPGCCDVYPRGADPIGGLIRDAAGNLYGTTYLGGAYRQGSIFKLDKTGRETVLHSFGGADGSGPWATMIMDSAGNLYGSTAYGGDITNCDIPVGCGTVFKLDPAGNLTTLYAFQGTFDGTMPIGNLVRDAQGNLYGTAGQGGSSSCVGTGCGTLFKLDMSGAITILHVFVNSDAYGCFPFGGLIGDRAGNLYGTANACAAGDNGTIFRLDPQGVITVLYNFKGGRDGRDSAAPLLRDAAGNLYGTTEFGGDLSCNLLGEQLGCGTVFKLDTTGQETVLYRFTGKKDGGFPTAGLVMDAAGKLYGTAPDAGDFGCEQFIGCGVVFAVTP